MIALLLLLACAPDCERAENLDACLGSAGHDELLPALRRLERAPSLQDEPHRRERLRSIIRLEDDPAPRAAALDAARASDDVELLALGLSQHIGPKHAAALCERQAPPFRQPRSARSVEMCALWGWLGDACAVRTDDAATAICTEWNLR